MNDEQQQEEEHEERPPSMNEILRGNRTRAQARKETFIGRLFGKKEEDENAGKS